MTSMLKLRLLFRHAKHRESVREVVRDKSGHYERVRSTESLGDSDKFVAGSQAHPLAVQDLGSKYPQADIQLRTKKEG